jgi:RNA polymerase sigma-70 factor (ECF subfamily)
LQRPESTCWTLVEGAAAGDRAAREEFGRRYLPVVRAYLQARWAGRLSPEELEDAVQDAFLALLREEGVLEKLRPGRREAFRPLLYAVVRNMALRMEHARARKLDRAGSQSFQAEDTPASEASLSRAFDRAWADSILRQAVDLQEELSRSQGEGALKRFELLRLLFDQERSIPEIAAEWGVASDSLHKELARAKREFKEALRRVVAFHHPQAPERVEGECRELLSLLD